MPGQSTAPHGPVAQQPTGPSDRCRQILNRLPVLVFELAADGVTRFVSESVTALTGFRPDELLGRNWWHIFFPADQFQQVEGLATRLLVSEVSRYELVLTTKSGVRLPMELSSANEYAADGSLATVVGWATKLAPRQSAQATERQLAAIVAGSVDAIVGETLDGVILSWNAGAARLYGYTAAETLGRSVFMLVPPDRAEELPALLRRLRRGERVEHFETIRVRKDGHLIHVSLTLSPVHDDAGALIGASTIARDITERKQTEEQVRLLAHAVESSSELICITDLADRFTFVNKAFLDAYGFAKEEILGRQPNILRAPGTPIQIGAQIHQMTRMGGWRGELMNRRKDGSEFPILLSTSVIEDNHGCSMGLLGIARDITEIKRAEKALRDSEARYRLLYDSNLVGVLQTTWDGRILDCNDSFAHILGYNNPDEILDHSVRDFYVDPGARTALLEQLRQRSILSNYEIRFRRKNGSRAWVLANVSLLPGDESPGILHGTIVDITERKLAERRLQEYVDRLKALSQQLLTTQETERRHLAGELHDEIGQMLTTISINLQAIKQQTDAALWPRLDESIGFVDQAIHQVRNLSLDLRPSLLDDLGLEAALRWHLDRVSQRSGLAVEFCSELAATRLPTYLETTCYRIVQEALTNIMRHAHAQHAWVRLRRRGNDVRLLIRDDGAGFDLAAARKRAAQGGNFGLLGMQERVQLQGGQFRIQSERGKGTVIRARFVLA